MSLLVSSFAGGGPEAYLSDLLQRGPAAARRGRRQATTSAAAAARRPLAVLAAAAVTGEGGGGKGETANQKMERPRALALPLVSGVQDLCYKFSEIGSYELNLCISLSMSSISQCKAPTHLGGGGLLAINKWEGQQALHNNSLQT